MIPEVLENIINDYKWRFEMVDHHDQWKSVLEQFVMFHQFVDPRRARQSVFEFNWRMGKGHGTAVRHIVSDIEKLSSLFG